MTEEDAFHAALDAAPEDHTARLVFADWLDERGDRRGPGYRALGRKGFAPTRLRPVPGSPRHDHWMFQLLSRRVPYSSECPRHTFDAADDAEVAWFRAAEPFVFGSHRRSRRLAEDRFALAFATLPPDVQAELLAEVHANG